MSENIYDLIIIGAGPAGFTASIYASRYKIKNVVIGKIMGGLASTAHKICNWPSEKAITGADLMARMQDSAKELGGEVMLDDVISVEKAKNSFTIKTMMGKEIVTRSILIASGTERRKLGIEAEKEFLGKGVSYCSTCDGAFFKDKVVGVVGGSDSANTAAIHLADVAKQVYQIYRKSELRGDPTWIEQVKSNKKIEVVYDANVVDLKGEEKLEKIVLDTDREIEVDGLFIEIGSSPHLGGLELLELETNDGGYIKVESDQSTNVDGVWAAGDITDGSNNFRQVITACAEGSVATESIYKYLKSNS
jgi:thioredoxin reductase (NADPH)